MKRYLALLLTLSLTTACTQSSTSEIVEDNAKDPTVFCNDASHTGEGTYYDGVAGTSNGHCSLPVASNDFLHVAMNSKDYDGSNSCGACVDITGPKGRITATVVDECPECAPGDIDMTEEAFSQIADVTDGRIDISWQYVPCDLSETISINFKDGASEHWSAIQFRDTEHAVAKMEYQLASGDWEEVEREDYNFFVNSDGIESPMYLRTTSILGEALEFENVILDSNLDFNTGLQFSTPQVCL